MIPDTFTPDQVADLWLDTVAWVDTDHGGAFAEMIHPSTRDHLRRFLPHADVFHVTAPIQDIAAEAADDLIGAPLHEHDVPTKNAFIVLDRYDDWQFNFPEGTAPIRAIHIASGDIAMGDPEGPDATGPYLPGVSISVWTDSDLPRQAAVKVDPTHRLAAMPYAPVCIMDATGWIYDRVWSITEVDGATTIGPVAGSFRAYLLGLLYLLTDDRYTERAPLGRHTRRRVERSTATPPEPGSVAVTDLRRPLRRSNPTNADGSSRYSHQWRVRGHWRRYHNGQLRDRPLWIEPYIKGPADAPFVPKRRVTRLKDTT